GTALGGGVGDRAGTHAYSGPLEGFAARHLLVGKREGKRFGRRVLVDRGPQGPHPPFGVRRAEDRERSRARVLVAILQEEKRQAAEVIAVEMGEKREVDRRRVVPGSLEGLQHARTTV